MKKKNKLLEILSFYTCVPQMMIIWCIVPEIWSATDKIFVILDNFLPIWKNEKNAWGYYYFTLMYHKWWSYDVWFLRYEVQRTEFFVILDHFLPFSPLRILKIKFKKNWKNAWRYHHFTQVCHKWQSYDAWFLRYGEWQTEFFFLMVSFFPFTILKTRKIKILQKWKKCLDINHFIIMLILFLILWSVMDVIVIFHFGLFFVLLPPDQRTHPT